LVDKDTQRNYSIEMNIFKELKKTPKVEINEVSYGAPRVKSDEYRKNISNARSHLIIEGKKAREWAEHYDVTIQSIWSRYYTYGHPHPREVHWAEQHEGKTVKEWAEHYGVSVPTIYNRIYTHGNPHATYKKYMKIEGKTPIQWAEHYGVHIYTITKRIKKYDSPHPQKRVDTLPMHRRAKKIEGKTAIQWAEHYGVSVAAIWRRIHTRGHPHPKKG